MHNIIGGNLYAIIHDDIIILNIIDIGTYMSILLSMLDSISSCCGPVMTNNITTNCKIDGGRLITVIITIITIIASVYIRNRRRVGECDPEDLGR